LCTPPATFDILDGRYLLNLLFKFSLFLLEPLHHLEIPLSILFEFFLLILDFLELLSVSLSFGAPFN
jgi:hypothetical protein